LNGAIASEVGNCIRAFSEQKNCKIIELNVQIDHVHLLVKVPPKISISDFMGIIKGRTVIRVFNKFKHLTSKPYWGNKFWARGYCVDTVGLDSEMIRKYVKYQEQKEKRAEQRDLFS
jgi:putative transposase